MFAEITEKMKKIILTYPWLEHVNFCYTYSEKWDFPTFFIITKNGVIVAFNSVSAIEEYIKRQEILKRKYR